MDKSAFFASIGAYLRANKKFFILVAAIFISVFGYFWYRSGFTLDFNRFFAAGPEIVINNDGCGSSPCGPYSHGDVLSVSWSKLDAVECHALSGLGDIGGSTEGTASMAPLDACAADRAEINIECTNTDSTTENTVMRALIDTSTCPSGTPTPPPPPDATPTPPTATATPGLVPCSAATVNLRDTPGIGIGNGTASSRVRNDADMPCDVTLASYEIWSDRGGTAPHYISEQTLFDSQTRNLAPGEIFVFTVNLPACYSQVDVALGGVVTPPNYGNNFVGVQFQDVGDSDGTQLYCNELNQTPAPTPTPTPVPTPTATPVPSVACSLVGPSQVNVGQSTSFSASGGTGTYSWFAPGGTPPTGVSNPFSVIYATPGFKTVTVASGGNQATCTVTVVASSSTPTPTPTPTPTATITSTPTPAPTATPTTPGLSIQKSARNVTQNGAEVESATINPSEVVEFVVRISSTGTGSALAVVARDTLPSGLSYQTGSTTIDSVAAADGLLGSGLNLGTMVAGRTITIRFRATVAAASYFSIGTTVLVNTAYAQGSNVPSGSDTAFINVTRNPEAVTMSLSKMGRNITRGQTVEVSPVNASPTETIEFVIKARNTSAVALTNVQVRDIIPQGITYVAGSGRLNGQVISDTVATSGLNIGGLAVGQEAAITLSGRAAASGALPAGTTVLINAVQVSADTVPMLTAQLPVVITNPTSVTQVPTGPGESTVLALIVSTIITLLYVGYTSTDTYRRREAGQLVEESKEDKDLFNFRP